MESGFLEPFSKYWVLMEHHTRNFEILEQEIAITTKFSLKACFAPHCFLSSGLIWNKAVLKIVQRIEYVQMSYF